MLIEAELIRSRFPPFNRQMRRCNGYCYLCENGRLHRQLEVRRQPTPDGRSFGPYRSRRSAESVLEAAASHLSLADCPVEDPSDDRLPLLVEPGAGRLCERYYRRVCSGPCAGRVQPGDYEARLRRRDALLEGVDDTTLCELERRLEAAPDEDQGSPTFHDLARRASALRAAFDQAVTLREAERLMGGLLVLPGADDFLKTASLTPKGIRFGVLRENLADARRVLANHRRSTGGLSRGTGSGDVGRVPKIAMDSLCIAARQLRQPSTRCRFISRHHMAALSERDLLTTAFEGKV